MYFCLHTNLRYFWWQLLGKLVLEAKVLILAPKWLLLLGKQDLIREKESIVIPVVSNGTPGESNDCLFTETIATKSCGQVRRSEWS